MIPEKFHRIWFGTRERPAKYDIYWKRLQKLHPDGEFFTWTEANLFELQNQATFDALETTARGGVPMSHERTVAVMRADVAAYEIVLKHGGVYLNCDILPLKSFKPLLEHEAFLGMEDNYHVCNAVMGGIEGHPLYRDVVNGLALNVERYVSNGMEVASGPQYLTKTWRSGNYDIEVLPQDAFYSTHHGELPWGSVDYGAIAARGQERNAYAVHMWGHRTQEGKFNE